MTDLISRFEQTAGTMPRPEFLHTSIPYTVQKEWELEKSVRYEITYETEPGSMVRAFLFLPKVQNGRKPAVICPHPTHLTLGGACPAGLDGPETWYYACEIAERGNYAVLSPDTCYFGTRTDNPYELGYASGTMKTIFDYMRGIDLLASLDCVDSNRIGCIGHSLGGHNTVFVSTYDTRIKAAVSCCGLCAFGEYVKTNASKMDAWAQDCYMPRIRTVFDCDEKKMPWDFPELAANLAPRCALMINAARRENNMNFSGAKIVIDACEAAYAATGVSEKFLAVTPDTEHDFPDASRMIAYEFLEKHLGK